ncbi:MAG TPA: cupin domain-containing protein [Gammaproteobacteria bacterium]|nr:cupin domain-containing protein [Gammaproteobacteria bacterium]
MKQKVINADGAGDVLHCLGADVKFLCEAEKTDNAWSLMEVVLPENAGPPPHDHAWDEAYYVVAGDVRFSIEGKDQIVKAGGFVYAPGGTVHGFQGASKTPARVIIFDAPAHAEAFFREVDREVRRPEDMPKVPAIGERNGIRFRMAAG